jgi:hypothetical protein
VRRIVAVVVLVVSLGAAPAAGLHRVERQLAEVPAKGDTLRVFATVLQGQHGDPCFETAEIIRVVGRRSGEQFADTMPRFWREPASRLQAGVTVTATRVAWGKVRGVVLHRLYVNYTPAESPVSECRYLALQGRRLVPVTPWFDALGRTLPSRRILAEKSLGWFTVLVPIRAQTGRRADQLEPTPDRDAGSGLAVLQVSLEEVEERDSTDTSPARGIRLYRGPTGEAADSVFVSRATPIEYGPAYAEVGVGSAPRRWDDQPPWQVAELRVVLKRLAVVVGGRRGFVAEQDFPAIGLESEE